MSDQKGNKSISLKKLAANRSNAKRSTGPQTEAGKAKAAQNAYRHGFFALRLFPNDKLRAQDAADYDMVYSGMYKHYAPVGFMEHFWLEKIATEALRLARVLAYGQQVLEWQSPFEARSVERLLRYESTVNRNFAQAVENLELLQAERKTGSSQFDEPAEPEPGPMTGGLEPKSGGPAAEQHEALAEESTFVSTPEEVGARSTAEDDHAGSAGTVEPTPTDLEGADKATETVEGPTPPADTSETYQPPSCRWVETEEDQKMIDALHEELYGYRPL